MLADARVLAAAAYSAAPRMTRTSSVEPPLQATRRQRTLRTSLASASEAWASASSTGAGCGTAGGCGRSGDGSTIGKPIAHAADRLDPAPCLAELRAQVMDIGVDRVRRDRHGEGPCLVQELVARQRLARMAQEALEQRELARAEIHRSTADGDPAASLVERDRTGGEDRVRASRPGLGPASERSQPRGQLLVGERLDEVVVGAGIEARDAVVDRVPGGQHQDRQVALAPTNAARHVEAGDVRQPDVEDHGLDALRRVRELEGRLAVRRDLHHVAVILEQASQDALEAGVVLDEQ